MAARRARHVSCGATYYLFVALMLGTLPETRWLASLIGVNGADTGTPSPDAEVERT